MRNFLLSGANGFVGKITLWHLLKTFPQEQLGSVTVIIRHRGNISAADRFRESFLKPFPELADLVKTKVKVIDAQLTQPRLGLSAAAAQSVQATLTDAIHCAASVRFDSPMPQAKLANIDTLVNILDFCERCPQLRAFVHTSTAYVFPNTDLSRPRRCEETLVALPTELMERYSGDINAIHRALGQDSFSLEDLQRWGFPNSYTFTKAIAENVLAARRAHLPITVVRPSIIAGAFAHPSPGWTDSHAALGAYLYASAMGLVPLVQANKRTRPNVVPVDVVAQSLIAAATERGQQSQDKKIWFRFAVTDSDKTLTVKEITKISHHVFQHRRGRRWAGKPLIVKQRWLARILAYGLDELPRRYRIRRLEKRGRHKEARKMQLFGSHALKLMDQFEFFLSREFVFVTKHGWNCGPGENFRLPTAIICAGAVRYLLKQNLTGSVIAGREYLGYRPLWLSAATSVRGLLFNRLAAILSSVVLNRVFSRIEVNYLPFLGQLAQVPKGGKLILTPTHRSYFDFILLYYVFETRRELQFPDLQAAAANKFRKVWFFAWLMSWYGVFFIERSPQRRDLQLLKNQVQQIERHQGPLLMFPEGQRSRDGKLLPLKKGLLRMLSESERPTVFLPMLISYQQRADESELRSELAGSKKKMQGAKAALGWLWRALMGRVRLGQVQLVAGELVDPRRMKGSLDEEIGRQFQVLSEAHELLAQVEVKPTSKRPTQKLPRRRKRAVPAISS